MTINAHFVRKKANNNLAFLFTVRNFANKFRRMDKQYTEKQEKIARFAKALGHPARIAIMQFLAKQEQCYFGDIHEELPIAKATVSQHLKELKEAGLIQGEIEAPKVKYCINRPNWALAKNLFGAFFSDLAEKADGDGCC